MLLNDKIQSNNICYIDIETSTITTRDYSDVKITLFGAKFNGEYVIQRYPTAGWLTAFFKYLSDNNIITVLHNGDVFDVPVMRINGASNAFINYDTLILAYLAGARWSSDLGNRETADGQGSGSLSLKVLAREINGDWDINTVEWNTVFDILQRRKNGQQLDIVEMTTALEFTRKNNIEAFAESDLEQMFLVLESYLKKDLDATEFVFKKYAQNIDQYDINLHNYLMSVRDVYRKTHLRGLRVNRDRLNELISTSLQRRNELEVVCKHLFSNYAIGEVDAYFTDDLNLNSSDQLADLLYSKMRLPIHYRSEKTGEPSTDKRTLKRLAKEFPAVEKLLEYRDAKKEYEMLSKTIIEAIDETGTMYPQISVTTTKTGRTSSYGPNIQQIKRGDMRSVFEAPPGYVLVEFDYSTAEMRVAAELSRDRVMMNAFKDGVDIHTLMASVIVGRPMSEVTKAERQKAKAANFGLLFGQGFTGFREFAFVNYGVDFTEQEAKEIYNKFHTTYSGLGVDYYDRVDAMAVAEDGILFNLIGRKYYVGDGNFIPTLNPKTGRLGIDGSIRNAAVNYPVQSFANDMLLMSYAEVFHKLDNGVDFILSITVHDAMYAYIRDDEETIKYYIDRVCSIMRKPHLLKSLFDVELEVPMEADASLGYNWANKVDYKDWVKEKDEKRAASRQTN